MLRIEDTDTARNRPEWVEGILSALSAIGINAGDPALEGPYFQSANAELHRAAAARLFTEGRAYYCDCTREDVVARTGKKEAGYEGHCRERGLAYEPGRALQFRAPDDGQTVVADRIHQEATDAWDQAVPVLRALESTRATTVLGRIRRVVPELVKL